MDRNHAAGISTASTASDARISCQYWRRLSTVKLLEKELKIVQGRKRSTHSTDRILTWL